MRKFKNASKIKQKQLNKDFTEILKLYDGEATKTYNQTSICVFNHWLSQEEAIKEIDSISYQKEQEQNHKLHSFCIELAKSTECYLVKLLGKNKDIVTFREFTSESGLAKKLEPLHHFIGDNSRFVLALPELNIIYFEGCDFTHHVYYKNETNLQFISNLATEHGLYLLNEL